MALFKPFRGNRTGLDAVQKHDGYVYFCTDDGALFFDYIDNEGILQRKQVNAKNAETLTGMSLDEIKASIILTSQQVTHRESLLSNILENYILTIDYDMLLAFDTSEIVINATSTPTSTASVLGQAILGQMILA